MYFFALSFEKNASVFLLFAFLLAECMGKKLTIVRKDGTRCAIFVQLKKVRLVPFFPMLVALKAKGFIQFFVSHGTSYQGPGKWYACAPSLYCNKVSIK